MKSVGTRCDCSKKMRDIIRGNPWLMSTRTNQQTNRYEPMNRRLMLRSLKANMNAKISSVEPRCADTNVE